MALRGGGCVVSPSRTPTRVIRLAVGATVAPDRFVVGGSGGLGTRTIGLEERPNRADRRGHVTRADGALYVVCVRRRTALSAGEHP